MITEQTYRQVVVEDPEGQWELHDGRLREKPRMGAEHNELLTNLAGALIPQIDRRTHRLRLNSSHVRRSEQNYFIPDLCVIPAEDYREQRGKPGQLEVYETPLPLVIEIWSPSTGTYDVDTKIPAYQARGDLETWRVHPGSAP